MTGRITDVLVLPKEILIGGIYYDVVIVENLRSDEGVKLDGHIVYGRNEIRLEATLSEQAKWQVMLHEVVHGILSQAGQDMKDEAVDALAYGVLGFVQGNQWEVKVDPTN
jgi:hypothetical protein